MTNRLVTDDAQQVIWRWEGEAFGNTDAQVLGATTSNLRFPGQYFDSETNPHYNQFRYYDPKLGRYITSDPIGHRGGLNLYSYVISNPARSADPTGLYTFGLSFNVGGGAGYGGTSGVNFVFDTNGGFEVQQVVGGGSYVGVSGGFTITFEATTVDTIQQLHGFGVQVGGSVGEALFAEGGVMAGPDYVGVYGGGGIGGGATPAAGYIFITNTTPVTIFGSPDLVPGDLSNAFCTLNPSAPNCSLTCQ
jgi:RHS repeat-associated protein